MKNKRNFSFTIGIIFTLALFTNLLRAESVEYEVDLSHSSINFVTMHAGVSKAWGRFNDFSGNIKLDNEDLTKSEIEIKVKASSVDTNHSKRDDHLRGTDFFEVKKYPLITFKSSGVSKTSDNKFELKGELNFHGVTKEVSGMVEFYGYGKNNQAQDITGAEAIFKINRSEFGIKYGIPGIGDEVTIIISIEAIKK